jgi:hypothetical protein
MDQPSQPPAPAQEAEQRETARRDLVRAYKRCFASTDGRAVLADLEARCHWEDDPYSAGIVAGDLAYRCGTQSPIRYIHRQLAKELKPLGTKPRKASARSGLPPPA